MTWIALTGGKEVQLVWPVGWSARFSPKLEVLDPRGSVRFRDGDPISEVCFQGPTGAPSSLLMIPNLDAPAR